MIENSSLVTIICSCYNHQNYVINTLNSVVKQSYKPIQLIIIDDCSKDKSVDVINFWLEQNQNKDILFIKNPVNLGLNKSFNNAYKQAKGNYIMDLAADDILFPDGLEQLIHIFNTTPFKNCGTVFGNVKFYDVNKKFLNDYLPQDKKPPTGLIAKAFQGNEFEFCSVSGLHKREVYDRLNGYDEEFMYEDLDFWIRATRIYEVDYTSKFILNRYFTPTSLQESAYNTIGKRAFLMNFSTYKIMKKAFFENNNNQELNKSLLKRIAHFRKTLKYNVILKIKYLLLERKIKTSLK